MPAAGRYFVTPHAVRQFQSRIAALPYELALAAIIRGLAGCAAAPRRLESGALGLRVRDPYDFRVVIEAEAQHAGGKPAVVTVLRSGKSRRAKQRARARARAGES